MKVNLMERAFGYIDIPQEGKGRRLIVFGTAFTLHVIIFAALSIVPQTPFAIPEKPISVKLIFAEPSPSIEPNPVIDVPIDTPPVLPIPKPLIPNSPVPEPPPIKPPPPAKTALNEETVEPLPEPPPSAPLSILSTQDAQNGDPIPEKWRLPDGARSSLDKTSQPNNSQFEALTTALDCLGFDTDCAVQRKVVFAEDQLSETALVWMRSHAHSGLSNSDLYGLSEAQIRQRLGIMSAGQNGLMIFPGIAIDGPWWDALHGVNKACSYGIGVNEIGQKQLMKQCDPGKASSKDRIEFKPKLE